MSYKQMFEKFLKKELGLYYVESDVKQINFKNFNLNELTAWYYTHQTATKLTYYLLDAGGNIWRNHQCLGPKN